MESSSYILEYLSVCVHVLVMVQSDRGCTFASIVVGRNVSLHEQPGSDEAAWC